MIQVIKVRSSFIKGLQYNEESQRLRVEIGNACYYYYGVTKQKIARLKKAVSKGSYFCKYIKGQYKTIKRKAYGCKIK